MPNFAAIRSVVLEKMTFEVAIFRNFPGYSRTKIVTSAVAYGRPDVTLRSGTSCRVTVLVLFVRLSVKPDARRSFG